MEVIKRYIRIFQRRRQKAREKKKEREFLNNISGLVKCGTLSELDFSAGYHSGSITKAAEVGEITIQQRETLLKILTFIYKGERMEREAE